MNFDLHLTNKVMATTSEIVDGQVIDQIRRQNALPYELPSLQEILKNIGPLPDEALFLGLADDGFPVLLNLWDPTPGPLLVAGDSESGKTDFLKTLTSYVVSTHQPNEIQYGVITNRLYEWKSYVDYSHCIGIFSTAEKDATNFIQALVAWTETNRNSRQSVLLLIDELVDFIFWRSELGRELRQLLLYGPKKKIWPIATISLENSQAVAPWLEYFHTQIFGHTNHFIHGDSQGVDFDTLYTGVEFTLKEGSQWIRFRIPRITF